MSVLYIALFASIAGLVHRNIKKQKTLGESVLRARLTYWSMWGMMILMYLMTIYNAYFVDFYHLCGSPLYAHIIYVVSRYLDINFHFPVRYVHLLYAQDAESEIIL